MYAADIRKSDPKLAAIEHIPRPAMRSHTAAQQQGTLALPVKLYLAAVLLPIGFNIGPLYLNLLRIVLLVMFVPLTVKLFYGRYGRILVPDILFFAMMPWMAITTAINDPGQVLQSVGSTSLEFLGGYVLARAYIRTAADFTALSRAIILMIALTLPIAVYELKTNDPLVLQFLERIPGIRTEGVIRGPDEMRKGLYRVQAVFAHPIHYGMFGSIGFALCFVGLKGIFSTTRRYVMTAIITFCTLSSLSSGAWLPIFLQSGLITWAYMLNKIEKRWVILIGLIVLAYIYVSVMSNRPPLIVFATYTSFSSWNAYWRANIFEFGMQNVWANPWFGIGLTPDWARPAWMRTASVDNFWLVIAMRYGFPGIGLLLIGYVQPIWAIAIRKIDRGTMAWQQRRAWVMVFIGLTFALTTVHVWSTMYSFVFFMFGAGMWFLTTPAEESRSAADLERHPLAGPRSMTPRNPVLARDQSQPVVAVISSAETVAETVPVTNQKSGPRYTRFPRKTRSAASKPL